VNTTRFVAGDEVKVGIACVSQGGFSVRELVVRLEQHVRWNATVADGLPVFANAVGCDSIFPCMVTGRTVEMLNSRCIYKQKVDIRSINTSVSDAKIVEKASPIAAVYAQLTSDQLTYISFKCPAYEQYLDPYVGRLIHVSYHLVVELGGLAMQRTGISTPITIVRVPTTLQAKVVMGSSLDGASMMKASAGAAAADGVQVASVIVVPMANVQVGRSAVICTKDDEEVDFSAVVVAMPEKPIAAASLPSIITDSMYCVTAVQGLVGNPSWKPVLGALAPQDYAKAVVAPRNRDDMVYICVSPLCLLYYTMFTYYSERRRGHLPVCFSNLPSLLFLFSLT
jgi:hypothetical protein